MKKSTSEVEVGRWSARRKRQAMPRLFCVEDLDAVSRGRKVTAAKLS